jgi:adenine phosphoribosyltransferase
VSALEGRIRAAVRDVPDFPKPGIVFKDITPVLADPGLMTEITTHLAHGWRGAAVDVVVGMESRGFIFGAPLAMALGAAFAPARKPGKLPYRTLREHYALEYGEATLEVHEDAVRPGQRVLVVDDLVATGGTAVAAGQLARRLGGEVVGFAFVLELAFLGARALLAPSEVRSLVRYDG